MPTYVITEACVGRKDATCVDVCPAACIHTTPDAPQYYIDPDLAETIVRNSADTVQWMRGRGAKFVPNYGRQAFNVNGRFKFFGGIVIYANGGGRGLNVGHGHWRRLGRHSGNHGRGGFGPIAGHGVGKSAKFFQIS